MLWLVISTVCVCVCVFGHSLKERERVGSTVYGYRNSHFVIAQQSSGTNQTQHTIILVVIKRKTLNKDKQAKFK